MTWIFLYWSLPKDFEMRIEVFLFLLLFYAMVLSTVLLSFVVDILNQEMGRNVEVIQRQGAFLLIENGQLLHVALPKEGVNVHDFFETSKVRETLLIATRNEGKTKEFRAILIS